MSIDAKAMREEKGLGDHLHGDQFAINGDNEGIVEGDVNELQRGLSGIHTSMIAIGGAIGAGLFVSVGGAFANGGPASVLLGFIVIAIMMVMVMQALGELATLYPENGAFTAWIIRFIDPSWGFAMGMIYALSWLTVLPFELTAAGLTIDYWDSKTNVGVWITVFLVAMFTVQAFGVRVYGWTEVVLSLIKVSALIGFCIFAIVDDCGGISTNPGYKGFKTWGHGNAFRNGFHGFCSTFVTAAFSFGGTELVGLAAAETKNPEKQLPKAIRQTVVRIVLFYIVSLLLVGLLVQADNPHLLDAGSDATKYSIFVIALVNSGVKGLPSVFNVVITLSVISVANSCTYGSTRTFQALAARGMLPKFLAYVDKKGRPIPTIILQLLFAMLAFVNEASSAGDVLFNWLLALTSIAYFFVWGSICAAHIRFRMAWKRQGHSVEELPYRASFGVIGSWIGVILNLLALMASIYYAAAGLQGTMRVPFSAESFMQGILAIPCIIFFYLVWRIYSWFAVPAHRPLWVAIDKIDVHEGMRKFESVFGVGVPEDQRRRSVQEIQEERKLGPVGWVKKIVTSCF